MKIIIDGAGEIGSHLAKMLRAESNDITVIDSDASRLARLSSYADVETIQGHPSSVKVLKQAGVANADLFISVVPFVPQEVNMVAGLIAKKLGSGRVVIRINDEDCLSAENKLLFKSMGIELMFYPEKNAADEIVESLKHASAADTMDFARGKLQITVFRIDDDSPCVDRTLGEFISSLDPGFLSGIRIIAVARGEKTIIPNPETVFRYGDLLYVIALQEVEQELVSVFGRVQGEVHKVMILGGGSVGEMVARGLSRQVDTVKIIEKRKERCLELSERLPGNVLIVNGDGTNSDFLFEESINDYDAFVALSGSDETNVLSCVVAKKFGIHKTIAEVENMEYLSLSEEMGVDTVINKKLIAAGRIFKFTLSGRARFVKYMNGTRAEVIEYTVAPGSAITKAPLKDIDFPSDAIVGGVVRGSESFIATGSTQIEAYDRVAVFALPQTVKDTDKFFK